jgi:cytoskeletal protein CcmA (bactofilin family)
MIPPPSVADSLPQECEESVLGDSVSFCREFFGDRDAVIEGQVGGSPNSQECLITSGSRGRIKVDIHVRRVVVHGLVSGNVAAIEKTAIQRIGEDFGTMVVPGIAVEDGAYLNGSIAIFCEKPENLVLPPSKSN